LRVDVELEALGDVRIAVPAPREGRYLGGKIGDERGLDQVLFGERFEQHQLQRAPALLLGALDAQSAELRRKEFPVAQVAFDSLAADRLGDRQPVERLAEV